MQADYTYDRAHLARGHEVSPSLLTFLYLLVFFSPFLSSSLFLSSPPFLSSSSCLFCLQVCIWFDGSCNPNPGIGRVGSLIKLDRGEGTMTLGLGESTNNSAEYMALIRALQSLVVPPLSEYRITKLVVKGDSQLVISQVWGTWKCKQYRLRPLKSVVIGLLRRSRAAQTQGIHVKRAENAAADALSKSPPAPWTKMNTTIFYPNLCNLVRCTIMGKSILVSNDIGASWSDRVCSIDAGFLYTLPNGEKILEGLNQSHFECMQGSTDMTVIGFTPTPLKFILEQRVNGELRRWERIEQFLVVDNLPVPMHVHMKEGVVGVTESGLEFDGARLGEPYCSNPYWKKLNEMRVQVPKATVIIRK